MKLPKIASPTEWLAARKALLAKEKEFSKARDALAAARRDLPMTKIEKTYVFDGRDGKKSLADLFAGRTQLAVYHFMFDPEWDAGCKSCSFVSDGWDGVIPHLAARNTAFAAISRAPLRKIVAFQKRMGWTFPWLSSAENSFNFDFNVSFVEGKKNGDLGGYNISEAKFTHGHEAPGFTVFLKDGDAIYRGYSTYARGLDTLIHTYNVLDLTPLGRQEEGLSYGMEWVRHHDAYDATT